MIGRALLVVGLVLFGLLVLEVGCRVVRGTDSLLHWKNIVPDQRQAAWRASDLDSRFAYDPLLGYTQRPGLAAADLFTYDRNGYRNDPCRRCAYAGTLDGPPVILATGDSLHRQGDEVPDDQTWPAYLQAIVGRRTINAGVRSLWHRPDEVLRTEQLAARVKPSVIVRGLHRRRSAPRRR